MSRCGFRLVLCCVMVAAFASAAVAECAIPAQSGLAMCFPSAGSTVLYPASIELAANTGGVPITHVAVYDNSVKVDSLNFLPGTLVDYAIKNGHHQLTVNAWDANGKLYQAKGSFTVTGFGVGACTRGSGTITLCSPAQGSYQPESGLPISAAFAAGVKSWSITVDGKAFLNSTQIGMAGSNPLQTGTSAAAGSHTMVIKAVNSLGATSTLTRQFNTFYDLNCNPKTGVCNPGIQILQPSGVDVTGTSFRIQAEVVGNPKPTTKMIVYVDGVNKQQSAGPGITANVTTTPGSHYYVVQAWDTTGRMYESYGNLNVQTVSIQ